MAVYHLPRIKHEGLRETSDGEYTLVRYTKPLKDASLAKYRSVVYKGDRLVAFSPPRAVALEEFEAACPSAKNAVVREFVDGMMIYVWYDAGRWRTSTRSRVEGDKVFRRGAEPVSKLQEHDTTYAAPPTPKELFDEYLATLAFPLLERLDPINTYVFTLMHPSAFNVVKPSVLECYLTNVYKVLDGNTVQSVHLDSVLPALCLNSPVVHYFQSYTGVTDALEQRSYSMKGFMVYDPVTENRAKILNPAFKKVHDLLSSKPNFNEIVLEAMLVHKNENEIAGLHADFPDHIKALDRNLLRCANLLYSYYLQCFIKKEKAHKDFPVLYRVHMYELHKMYLQSFRALGFRMNKPVVLDYVKNLPVPLLLPLLGIH